MIADRRHERAAGRELLLRFAVIYRPIVSELSRLDTEIGQNYYEEVVGPEFRSVARGVFARHSWVSILIVVVPSVIWTRSG